MGVKEKLACFIFFLGTGYLVTGCSESEKMYLDYQEVAAQSDYQIDISDYNSPFRVYNNTDTIYFHRTDEPVVISSKDFFGKINITPLDTAIIRLSKIPFDNLTPEKEKSLPELFIIKKDSLNNELRIYEIRQSFVISEDNFEIN